MIVLAEVPTAATIFESDVLFVCHHEPRAVWIDVHGAGFTSTSTDGETYTADWVAVCDACHAKPLRELDLLLARRAREGTA